MVSLVAVTLVLMSYTGVVVIFVAPHAPACRRNLWRDLKILVPLRTAVLQLPSQSYVDRRERS
jgi:hypothetical protein